MKKRTALSLLILISFQSICFADQGKMSQKNKIPKPWQVRALWKAIREANKAVNICLQRRCFQEKAELEKARAILRNVQEKGHAAVQRESRLGDAGVYGQLREKENGYHACRNTKCKTEETHTKRIGMRLAAALAVLSAAGITVGGLVADGAASFPR